MSAAPGGSPVKISAARARRVQHRLLAWYGEQARALPWRGSLDPYAIWVSEVMLQQTQVATVLPYFERFLARFPNVEALANAGEQELLRYWVGLGYYARARGLLAAARAIAGRPDAAFPTTASELRQLPGIGRYTANAIASLAFGEPVAVVEGNVMRVLCRLFAVGGDPRRGETNRALWDAAQRLLPADRPGHFNSAIMELGALVCRPAQPRCHACPVRGECRAFRSGNVEGFPETAPRPPVTDVQMTAAIVCRGDRFLLVQRAPHGRWAGLWQFPNVENRLGEALETAARRALTESVGLDCTVDRHLARLRHSFTRYRICLDAFICRGRLDAQGPRGGRGSAWVSPAEVGEYPLPSVHRRLAGLLAEPEGREPD